MKVTLIVVIILCLVGLSIGIGYIVVTRSSSQPEKKVAPLVAKTTIVTGTLQKVNAPGQDYTHMLTTKDGLVGINSYSVHLDSYVGKTVTISGQYSGKTLFADTVTETK